MSASHESALRPILLLAAAALAWFSMPLIADPDRPAAAAVKPSALVWQPLPDLPDPLGVAGPLVGVHNDALIVAGGANFPQPAWETQKIWRDAVHVLTQSEQGYVWRDGGRLPRTLGYSACVSTPQGVVCIGGNDATATSRAVLLLRWEAETHRVTTTEYPPLPHPIVYGQAVLIGHVIYLVGGQTGATLDTAVNDVWSLDLSLRDDPQAFIWSEQPPCPGPARSFHVAARQRHSDDLCLYVISGRRQSGDAVEFLTDVWEFTPSTSIWRRCADAPHCVMAGAGSEWGSSQIVVLSGDDGSRFHQTDELRDRHPGFPREVLAYDVAADRWTSLGPSPQNQVTTTAVEWNGKIILASGEVRPRVRTPAVWSISPE